MHMQYACLQCVVSWNLSANVCMCSVKAVVSHAVAMPCSVWCICAVIAQVCGRVVYLCGVWT